MFCSKCGRKNSDGDAFCGYCGAKLNRGSSTIRNQTQVASEQNGLPQSQTTTIESQDTLQEKTKPGETQTMQGAAPQDDSVSLSTPSETDNSTFANVGPNFNNPMQAEVLQTPQQSSVRKASPQQNPFSNTQHTSVPQSFPSTSPAPVIAGATQNASATTPPKKNILFICIFLIILATVGIAALLTGGFGLFKVTPKSHVNDYTWDELSMISTEISTATDQSAAIDIAKEYNLVNQKGKLDGTQTKKIDLSDGRSATVQIAGFAHDDKSDGTGKAGITFIFVDSVSNQPMNASYTNAGGWEKSQMRNWLETSGILLMPEDLKNNIVSVSKQTNNAGKTSDSTSITKTEDTLWLLSASEIYGSVGIFSGADSYCNTILSSEGTEYKLFEEMGTDAGDNVTGLVKNGKGGASAWWLRSPLPSSPDSYCTVNQNGHFSNSFAIDFYSVVPGFCI